MPNCDVCGKVITEEEMAVLQPSVIVEATEKGYVPAKLPHEELFTAFKRTRGEVWQETVARFRESPWGLCSRCLEALQGRVGEEAVEKAIARRGSSPAKGSVDREERDGDDAETSAQGTDFAPLSTDSGGTTGGQVLKSGYYECTGCHPEHGALVSIQKAGAQEAKLSVQPSKYALLLANFGAKLGVQPRLVRKFFTRGDIFTACPNCGHLPSGGDLTGWALVEERADEPSLARQQTGSQRIGAYRVSDWPGTELEFPEPPSRTVQALQAFRSWVQQWRESSGYLLVRDTAFFLGLFIMAFYGLLISLRLLGYGRGSLALGMFLSWPAIIVIMASVLWAVLTSLVAVARKRETQTTPGRREGKGELTPPGASSQREPSQSPAVALHAEAPASTEVKEIRRIFLIGKDLVIRGDDRELTFPLKDCEDVAALLDTIDAEVGKAFGRGLHITDSRRIRDLWQRVKGPAPVPRRTGQPEAVAPKPPGSKESHEFTRSLTVSADERKIAWLDRQEIVVAATHTGSVLTRRSERCVRFPHESVFVDNDRLLVWDAPRLALFDDGLRQIALLELHECFLTDPTVNHDARIVAARKGVINDLVCVDASGDTLAYRFFDEGQIYSGPRFGPDGQLYFIQHYCLYQMRGEERIRIMPGDHCICFDSSGTVYCGGGHSDRSGESSLHVGDLATGDTTSIPWGSDPIDDILDAGNGRVLIGTRFDDTYPEFGNAVVTLFSVRQRKKLWELSVDGLTHARENPLLAAAPEENWALLRYGDDLRQVSLEDGSTMRTFPKPSSDSDFIEARWLKSRRLLLISGVPYDSGFGTLDFYWLERADGSRQTEASVQDGQERSTAEQVSTETDADEKMTPGGRRARQAVEIASIAPQTESALAGPSQQREPAEVSNPLKVYAIPSIAVSLDFMGAGDMAVELAVKQFYWIERWCPDEAKDALRGHIVGRNEHQPVIVGIVYQGTEEQETALVSWLRDDFLPRVGFTKPPYDPSLQRAGVPLGDFRRQLTEIKEEVSYTGAKLVPADSDESDADAETGDEIPESAGADSGPSEEESGRIAVQEQQAAPSTERLDEMLKEFVEFVDLSGLRDVPPHRDELVSMGEAAVGAIYESIQAIRPGFDCESDFRNRGELCRVLADIGTDECVELLGTIALQHSNVYEFSKWIRPAAVEGLQKIGTERCHDFLKQVKAKNFPSF